MQTIPPGVRWTTISRYVDKETGEEITPHNAKKNYVIESKEKTVLLNYNKTKGYVEITNICTKNGKQLSLY